MVNKNDKVMVNGMFGTSIKQISNLAWQPICHHQKTLLAFN
jgi:hypothetical protein